MFSRARARKLGWFYMDRNWFEFLVLALTLVDLVALQPFDVKTPLRCLQCLRVWRLAAVGGGVGGSFRRTLRDQMRGLVLR